MSSRLKKKKKQQHNIEIACRCRWWVRCILCWIVINFFCRFLFLSLSLSIRVEIRALMTANMWHYSSIYSWVINSNLSWFHLAGALFSSSSSSSSSSNDYIRKRLLAVVKRSFLKTSSIQSHRIAHRVRDSLAWLSSERWQSNWNGTTISKSRFYL